MLPKEPASKEELEAALIENANKAIEANYFRYKAQIVLDEAQIEFSKRQAAVNQLSIEFEQIRSKLLAIGLEAKNGAI